MLRLLLPVHRTGDAGKIYKCTLSVHAAVQANRPAALWPVSAVYST